MSAQIAQQGYSNITGCANCGKISPLPEHHIGSWSWRENGLPLPPAHLSAMAEEVFPILAQKPWWYYQIRNALKKAELWICLFVNFPPHMIPFSPLSWPSGFIPMSNRILDLEPVDGTATDESGEFEGSWPDKLQSPHFPIIITWIFPPPERSTAQCGDSFWSGQGTYYGVENFRWWVISCNISNFLPTYNLSGNPVPK